MPITPDPPFPKTQGDNVRSKDWNDAVNEVIRLDNAKTNRSGDHFTGPLTIDGNVGIGTVGPVERLEVNGRIKAGALTIGPWPANPGNYVFFGTNALDQAVAGNYALLQGAAGGDQGVTFLNSPKSIQLRIGNLDKLTIDNAGNVNLSAELQIPKTGGGSAAFTNQQLDNENQFRPNNLKLRMANTGFIIGPPLQYEFAIGHSFFSLIIGGGGTSSFIKRFSINQNGDLFCSGDKTGYIVDYFINRVGDTLEQGDVVVIGDNQEMRFYGTNNDIPIPEVDLTDRPYDRRVCGIVAKFVTEADMPSVDFKPITEEEAARLKEPPSFENPLLPLAAKAEAQTDHTRVADGQLGKMATLGAFAHCKVDADIAPIVAGDLLTTSPTKGHAQKVLAPPKALGAIVGKALAPLKKGKGKIPVLVMLQ